jgi:hypothetical protein
VIRIERVEGRTDDAWEEFLDGDTDGSLFHRLSFLSYHPADRFRSHHLRAYRKDRLVAVIPLAENEGDDAPTLGSPYGGSFGGFACGPGLAAADHLALLDALVEYTRAAGFARLRISSRPSLYRIHGDGAEYALGRRGGRVTGREVTHVADLRGGEDAVRGRIRGTSRRGARKAERIGTTVREGDAADLPAFHAVLAQDRARLGATPTHTREELEAIFAVRPADTRLWLAENEGHCVGGKLVFRATPTVALGFYTARADDPASERCTSLLTEAAMLALAADGFSFLDYGTSSIGGELNPGLSEFKEGFGGVPYLRETWRLEL